MKSIFHILSVVVLIYFGIGTLRAQDTVVMPHNDKDTLYLNTNQCYTILDPGGLAHYSNNEDSWLYILSDNDFILNIDYATGVTNDGNDYFDIYYDTTIISYPSTPYAHYCGRGSTTWNSYNKRAVIHFHTNDFAVYDGFIISLSFTNTINNVRVLSRTESSAQIAWQDNQVGASSWTVHYFCDKDSLLSQTTTSTTTTLTGLRNNTFYAYYVTNDVNSCMNYSTYYFLLPNSDYRRYLSPNGYYPQYDTLSFGNCYTLFNSTGPLNNKLDINNEQLTLMTLDSCPFYIVGDYSLPSGKSLYGTIWTHVGSMSAISHSGESHGSDYLYCPLGRFQMYAYADFNLQYRILWENSAVIRPTVTNLSSTGATLNWSDAGGSTSYRVGYSCDGVNWNYQETSATTFNLSGLQPKRQYLYTIQGNAENSNCLLPARHAFVTSQSTDTILMAYRGNDTLMVMPASCYTLLDPGGMNKYFSNDHAILTLQSANGRGFRITGSFNIHNSDRLCIYDGTQWNNYSNANGNFYLNCPQGNAQICFISDNQSEADGFVLTIEQSDQSISNLQANNITANSAAISWADASGATAWEVHYGKSEDQLFTVSTTTPSVTLTNLDSATQYIYLVTLPGQHNPCSFAERRSFITTGLPQNVRLMPYRGTDTLWVAPGTCYTIWDAGGEDNDYFDYDTSQMVIRSTDGGNFYLTGGYDYKDNYDYSQHGYDSHDQLRYSRYQSSSYWNGTIDGSYSPQFNRPYRMQSNNGFLRLQFCSNHNYHRKGYHFTVDRDLNQISNIVFGHVTQNSVEVTWSDNSSGPWTVYCTPADGGATSTLSATSRYAIINGLAPSTTYHVSISNNSSENACNLRKNEVTTLSRGDIVMRSHHHDTIYLHPDSCYTIYDPGGTGNYLPSEDCSLVLRTTSGLGFMLQGSVYKSDRYDTITYSIYNPNGQARIVVKTNEALQDQGFAFKVLFYPTIRQVDTIQVTDNEATITWLDTTASSLWTIHYGPRRDSMQTITTTTRSATLTGLRRNTQCFIEIENDFGSPDCIIPSVYGLLMPHDNDYWICQYVNNQLNSIGIHSGFEHNYDVLPSEACPRIYSNSGLGSLFPNDCGSHTFSNNQQVGCYLMGDYNMGDASIYISASPSSSYLYNAGTLNLYSKNTNFSIQTRSGNLYGSFPEGFVFSPSFNYPVFNIHDEHISCNSSRLTWNDTSSATSWSIAYGTSEHDLDTVACSQRSHLFTNLTPDRQYVCYIWSNRSGVSCSQPVKYYFLTTCDSTYIIMPGDKDTTITISIDSCYTVTDPGGPNDYFYNNTQMLRLQSNTGDAFVLRGWMDLGSAEYLNIYDEISGRTLFYGSGLQNNIEIQTQSGRIRIQFNSNCDTLISAGFEFQIRFNSIYNIHTELMTDTSCRIGWEDHSSGTQWQFHYGTDKNLMSTISTTKKMVHLDNLTPGTQYFVYITNNSAECIDTTWFEFCAGGENCVDFTNLYACSAHPTYGYVYNADYYQGIVDYGYDNILSRHTVVDDTTVYDPRTGNQLRCTPPGETHAMRLGNWDIGGEAESISYEYMVDTSINNILLLRYAAVLENPGHSAANQPRFRFSLVDERGNELDHYCYSADFISSIDLGWNEYHYDTNYVLWKDWTPVGIDLEPFHGQRVFVKLTTYDCGEMGHYGYAYFHLSCTQKTIRVGACGVVDTNVFTAPEGFRYRWYNIDSADVTLSTERTFHSDQAGIYRCRCSFVGNTSSNCYFEKTVVVGSVFPYAAYRYEIIDTNECNVAVKFYNQSCVATDSLRSHLTSMECDDFFWDFGDGSTSYEANPTHIFAPGHYEVTLQSSLASLECSDDSTRILATPSPCIRFDTVSPVICHNSTYTLLDTTLYTPDTTLVTPPTDIVHQTHFVRRDYRPDSIVETTIYLTINPVFWNDTHIVACDSFYWSQTDSTYLVSTLADKLWQNQYSCDSVYRLDLQVERSYDSSLAASGCDNVGYILFNDTIFQSGSYIDSLYTVWGCDSILHLEITIHPAYNTDTFATDCDQFYWPRHDSTYHLDTLATRWLTVYDTLRSIHNCDSLFTLHLTLHPSYHFNDSIYLCRNEVYTYNGHDYTAPANFVYSTTSMNFCDSVHNVWLFIHDTLFKADWLLSDDSVSWSADTLFENCTPFTLWGRDQSVNATYIEWIFDDDQTSEDGTVSHPYEAGSYLPALIATSADNCHDTVTLSHHITIFPSPKARFHWDPLNPSDALPQATFYNLSYPNDSSCYYRWHFQKSAGSDEFDSSDAVSPTYVWEVGDLREPALVAARLIAYQTFVAPSDSVVTCTDTLTDTITILSDFLQFPNLVTPNGDGTNDTWIVINLLEYNRYPVNHLTIYDRWGHTVYDVENIATEEQFWDPAATRTPDGTYFFVFVGRGENDAYAIRRTGAIEVLGSGNK